MLTLKARITPQSAFGTPLRGDTLFGQLCWALRNRLGECKLNQLLDGYTANQPFAVISDAFPAGHLPRPAMPAHRFNPIPDDDRKAAKKRIWLPIEQFDQPLADWLQYCRPNSDLPGGAVQSHPHAHNAIDRRTNTTGEGFAPYSMTRHWYGKQGAPSTQDAFSSHQAPLDLYIVLDEARLSETDLKQAMQDIGDLGFGRDAGIGLGRYNVDTLAPVVLPAQADADAWMTLAPSAPQGMPWQTHRCFYTVFTRFGRHGDIGVHFGNPFKAPVMLANTGAVLTPRPLAEEEPRGQVFFTGQGLGGETANGKGALSKAIPGTVHQGYAPVVNIKLPRSGGNNHD